MEPSVLLLLLPLLPPLLQPLILLLQVLQVLPLLRTCVVPVQLHSDWLSGAKCALE
jgi:hypothetical protein